jgi:hypothetical protein
MITVKMLHSTEEKDLKRMFAWLTKSGMGLVFGSCPIGGYQCYQFAAMDVLAEKLAPFNPALTDCLSVETAEFGNKYVYLIPCNASGRQIGAAKRVVDTSYVFTQADKAVRT